MKNKSGTIKHHAIKQKPSETRKRLEQAIADRTAELIAERDRLCAEIVERRRIEEELRDSEERYRRVMESIAMGVSIINPAMEIMTLNKQMQDWFPDIDMERRAVCYRSFCIPPRDGICPGCPVQLTLEDGDVHETMTSTRHGKEVRHYRIISSPLQDRYGRLTAAIEVVVDLTDVFRAKQRVEESEVLYKAIFETTGTAMVLLDKNMRILEANREFERLSGSTKMKIEGRNVWMEFIHPDDLKIFKSYHHTRGKNTPTAPPSHEFRFRNCAGHVRNVLVTVALIPGTSNIVSSLLDITERKQAEEALNKRDKELAMESERLREANTALKVLLRHREEDKAELEKTILANVKKLVAPYLETLKKSSLSTTQNDLVDVIRTNLHNVISPFLRTLTAQYKDLTPREIDVANLVKEGKTAKEIAELLNSSTRSIEFHKNNIRIKLGLINRKTNLRSYLLSLSPARD